MPSVVIELVNGSIAAVYGSDPDIEVTVENGDIELTDEQESEIELEVAIRNSLENLKRYTREKEGRF